MSAPERSSLLTAARRDRDLDALASGMVVDVLVVGGGITGAGVALDAAARGLSVALVERGTVADETGVAERLADALERLITIDR